MSRPKGKDEVVKEFLTEEFGERINGTWKALDRLAEETGENVITFHNPPETEKNIYAKKIFNYIEHLNIKKHLWGSYLAEDVAVKLFKKNGMKKMKK